MNDIQKHLIAKKIYETDCQLCPRIHNGPCKASFAASSYRQFEFTEYEIQLGRCYNYLIRERAKRNE